MTDPVPYPMLLLLGAIVTVDGTSVGQFMISRPIVAATLAGWLAGSPELGIIVGVILEAYHLSVVPFGASRYPEPGAPAVVGGAIYAASGGGVGTLVTVLLFVLVWEWVCGMSVGPLRRVNMRIRPDAARHTLTPELIRGRHLSGIALDALRGVLLTGSGMVLLWLLLAAPRPMWGAAEWVAWLALGATATASLAATVRLFGLRRLRFFLSGAVAGLLALLFW